MEISSKFDDLAFQNVLVSGSAFLDYEFFCTGSKKTKPRPYLILSKDNRNTVLVAMTTTQPPRGKLFRQDDYLITRGDHSPFDYITYIRLRELECKDTTVIKNSFKNKKIGFLKKIIPANIMTLIIKQIQHIDVIEGKHKKRLKKEYNL